MNMITKQMYESWMVEHGQRFYRMAYSYMKNEQDALEVISEATYKGLKNLHRLREPDFFVTWMTRIICAARSVCFRLRQQRWHFLKLQHLKLSHLWRKTYSIMICMKRLIC